MKVLVPLAEGFEEIEAITIIDVLRRAAIDVTTAAVGKNPVTGSHGISVTADRMLADVGAAGFDSIVLPGGMPGSLNLKNSERVIAAVNEIHARGGITAAICAAPIVLGHAGVLKGKKATCYPGNEKELDGATHIPEPVVADGSVITGKGAGCAIPFALKLVEVMKGEKAAADLKNAMQVYWM